MSTIFVLAAMLRALIGKIFALFSEDIAMVVRFFVNNLFLYKVLLVATEAVTYVAGGGSFTFAYFFGLLNGYALIFIGAFFFLLFFDYFVIPGERKVFLATFVVNLVFVLYDSNFLKVVILAVYNFVA